MKKLLFALLIIILVSCSNNQSKLCKNNWELSKVELHNYDGKIIPTTDSYYAEKINLEFNNEGDLIYHYQNGVKTVQRYKLDGDNLTVTEDGQDVTVNILRLTKDVLELKVPSGDSLYEVKTFIAIK